MKVYQYKIFNMSEISNKLIEDKKTEKANLITVLNGHGANGWKVCLKIKDTSYLMIREVDAELIPT